MKQEDTYNYKGWLTSDNWFKRAFGVWGYMLGAYLCFLVGVFTLFFVLGILGVAIN